MRILLAPAAGMRADSVWMRAWRDRFASLGPVTTFDWPYVAAGKRRPDPLPVLREALRAAVPAGEGPLVLIGKSMGSRVACVVAAEVGARAVVAFGYPLVPASGKVAEREAVLLGVSVPVLFVTGTRDAMCPLDHLARVRTQMSAPNEVFPVERADHSLRTRVGTDPVIFDAVAGFLARRA